MMKGYHNLLKAHAGKTLDKKLYTPDPSIGVGDAEYMGSVGIKPNYQSAQQKLKAKEITTSEDTINLGKGKQFYTDQFPSEFYLGEGV